MSEADLIRSLPRLSNGIHIYQNLDVFYWKYGL